MLARAASSQAMVAVWLVALVLAAGLIWSILIHFERTPGPVFLNFAPRQLHLSEELDRLRAQAGRSAPFAAFIGTSLFLYAIPSTPPTAILFADAPDGAYSLRLAKGARTDKDIVRLLTYAVDQGVHKIYVEINLLLQDYFLEADAATRLRVRKAVMHQTLVEMNLFINDLIVHASSSIATLLSLGRPSLRNVTHTGSATEDLVPVEIENGWLDQLHYSPDTNSGELQYKIALHPPRQSREISAALALARKKQTEVVFVSMPKSETEFRRMGLKFDQGYQELLDIFAQRFDAPILRWGTHWTDDYFSDRAHVNLKGRTKLLDRIRAYEARLR